MSQLPRLAPRSTAKLLYLGSRASTSRMVFFVSGWARLPHAGGVVAREQPGPPRRPGAPVPGPCSVDEEAYDLRKVGFTGPRERAEAEIVRRYRGQAGELRAGFHRWRGAGPGLLVHAVLPE